MIPTRLLACATAALSMAAVSAPASAQALQEDAPESAFGEYSYYNTWPRLNPDDLIDPSLWASCWAFTKGERERLTALSREVPEPLSTELREASYYYQAAEIYYNELVRGTAIHNGVSTRETNEQMEIEVQSLIGGAQQWLSKNAADCIAKMPDREMEEFAELYPWLADALGTAYTQ